MTETPKCGDAQPGFAAFQSGMLKDVDVGWLNQALGSCMRAAMSIATTMATTDLSNNEACRTLNNRIMRVTHEL